MARISAIATNRRASKVRNVLVVSVVLVKWSPASRSSKRVAHETVYLSHAPIPQPALDVCRLFLVRPRRFHAVSSSLAFDPPSSADLSSDTYLTSRRRQPFRGTSPKSSWVSDDDIARKVGSSLALPPLYFFLFLFVFFFFFFAGAAPLPRSL